MVCRRANQAVKAPVSARESTLLQSGIQPFEMLKHFVDERTLPSKRTIAGIIRESGPKKVQKAAAWKLIFAVVR